MLFDNEDIIRCS